MIYIMEITETLQKIFAVEADDEKSAYEAAQLAHIREEIVLDESNITDIEIELYSSQDYFEGLDLFDSTGVLVEDSVVRTSSNKTTKMSLEEMLGCMRGEFKMADDFDAPLDDFKEYMD